MIVSPESWDHVFVSKHHYAKTLARRSNKVFFLNPPSKTYHIRDSVYSNLRVVDFPGFLPKLRYFPTFIRKWNLLRIWRKLENICDTKFDVIWSFDNSVFFDMAHLPSGELMKISHLMDIHQDFQLAKAASGADVCLGVIPEIVASLKEHNEHSYLIKHGVQPRPDTHTSVSLPGHNSMKALYLGNLSMPHINWNVLCQAASNFTEVDFIAIGSNQKPFSSSRMREFFSFTNTYYHAPISSEEVYAYLSASDILLLAYTPEYSKQYASPHKLLEYLQSGRSIVMSYIEGYEEVDDLVYMTATDTDWLARLKKVIQTLPECNSETLISRRKRYADSNSYDNRLEEIEQIIDELFSKKS